MDNKTFCFILLILFSVSGPLSSKTEDVFHITGVEGLKWGSSIKQVIKAKGKPDDEFVQNDFGYGGKNIKMNKIEITYKNQTTMNWKPNIKLQFWEDTGLIKVEYVFDTRYVNLKKETNRQSSICQHLNEKLYPLIEISQTSLKSDTGNILEKTRFFCHSMSPVNKNNLRVWEDSLNHKVKIFPAEENESFSQKLKISSDTFADWTSFIVNQQEPRWR